MLLAAAGSSNEVPRGKQGETDLGTCRSRLKLWEAHLAV